MHRILTTAARRALLVFTVVTGWLASPGRTQELPRTKEHVRDLGKTLGFCYSQAKVLDQIREQHPSLAESVGATEADWKSNFGAALDGAEARIRGVLKGDFAATKSDLIASIDAQLAEQKLSREEAEGFLAEVRQRAKGEIMSPVREMLLASKPDFAKAPHLEFRKGYVENYSTKDHPRAKGVNLTLKYPMSWKRSEGTHPDIAQGWACDGGHGRHAFMISFSKWAAGEKEQDAFFDPAMAKEMVPDGSRLLRTSMGKAAGRRMRLIHFTGTVPGAGKRAKHRAAICVFVVGETLCQYQRMSYAREDETDEALEKAFETLEPLHQLILDSIALPDAVPARSK